MKKTLLLCGLLIILTGCGEKELYCEKGTLKDGKCEITNTSTPKYSCEDGYTLDGTTCVHKEDTEAVETKSCNDGYTLKGDTCVSDKSYSKVTVQVCEIPTNYISPTGVYERLEDATIAQDNKCYLTVCNSVNSETKECTFGRVEEIPFTPRKVCPTGTSEILGKCKKSAAPKLSYSCDEGELDSKTCHITRLLDANASCPSGYNFNKDTKKCENVTTKEAQER